MGDATDQAQVVGDVGEPVGIDRAHDRHIGGGEQRQGLGARERVDHDQVGSHRQQLFGFGADGVNTADRLRDEREGGIEGDLVHGHEAFAGLQLEQHLCRQYRTGDDALRRRRGRPRRIVPRPRLTAGQQPEQEQEGGVGRTKGHRAIIA
jgi:hypothetical protein